MKKDIAQSIFKSPQWELRPKLHRYPTKRWGHSGTINKNKLYVYGGKTGKLKEPIYEIDCDTFESNILDVNGFPDSRESHSCSVVKDKLLIWGGCRLEKALNDCISISVKEKHCVWSLIPQFPMIKERESHATTVLENKFVFLYGGCNEDEIYDDFWVFNTEIEVWMEIKQIIGKMKKRLSCSLTQIRNKIYMFGGENQEENYEDELYCLTFPNLEFSPKDKLPTMTCQKIFPNQGVSPPARSSHSAVAYADQFLIILGGEGPCTEGKGKKTSALLNDVWCFDVENISWTRLEIPNGHIFKPRSCFSANVYRNKIYIFGGLISIDSFKSSDEFLVLSFAETTEKSLDLCNLCKLHYQPIDSLHHNKPIIIPNRPSFEFNLKNMYKFSRMIKNPFDAICLIFEAYYRIGFNSVIFDIIEGRILIIQGEGVEISEENFSHILKKYEFVEELNTEDPLILSALEHRKERENLEILSFNIKNACARLGQSFLIINRRSVLFDLMLITPENIFYVEFNSEDKCIGAHQDRSYEIIKNHLQTHNLSLSLIETSTFTVVVTDLQKISATQSEIKVNEKGDVELALSNKKMNLHEYCKDMFLTKPSIKVSINKKMIDFCDQQEEFKDCTYETDVENDFKSLHIRQAQKESFIAIYRGGQRVGKFIKKNPPYLEGYIEISLTYELNLLRHRVENTQTVDTQLKTICLEFDECGGKRRSSMPIYDLQNALV